MSEQQNPLKVGVIGLGRAGWDIHVLRLRDDKRFSVSAVNDLNDDRRAQAQTELGSEPFSNYDEFLKNADCELVIVASQSVDHARHTIEALESGRHVVVEKPMAMNTTEAQRMIDASHAAGKKLFVHQNYRYNPDVRHIQEVVSSGLLGRVFEIRVRALNFSRRNDWQTLQKYGGGNLNNTCPHFIDAGLVLLESPLKSMFADLQLTTDVGDADDHAKIILKGENGRVIDLEISTSCAFTEPKWTVLGTAGTLRSDGTTSEIKYFDPAELKPLVVQEGTPANRAYGSGEELPWREETRSSLAEVPSDFYDNVFAVLRNGAAMDILPEQVLEVIRVIEKSHADNAPL